MSLVVSLTKKLAAGCKGGVESIMPHLTWLARDFSLRLQNANGEPITPNQYLENSIHPTGNPDKDRVRNVLRASFPRRSCTTIIRPVTEESDLQGDILACPNLRPEFVEQMNAFRTSLFDAATVKKINGLAMTGPLLADMIESWLGGINKGGVPRMDDSWTALCQSRNMVAMKAATKTFDDGIQMIKLPTAHDSIHSRLLDLKSAAVDSYKEHRFVAQNDAFLEELEDYVDGVIVRIVKQNKSITDANLERILTEFVSPLKGRVDAGYYTNADDFHKDYESAKADFTAEIKTLFGSTKAVNAHIHVFYVKTQTILMASIRVICGKSQQQVDELQKQIETIKGENASEIEKRKSLERDIATHMTTIDDLNRVKAEMAANISNMEGEIATMKEQHEQARIQWREDAEKRRNEESQEMETWKQSMIERMDEHNVEKKALSEQIVQLENGRKDADVKMAKLSEELDSASSRLQRMDEFAQEAATAQQNVSRLQKEVKTQLEITEELNAAISRLKKQQSESIQVLQTQLATQLSKVKRSLQEKETECLSEKEKHAATSKILGEAQASIEQKDVEMKDLQDAHASALQQYAKTKSDLDAEREQRLADAKKHSEAYNTLQGQKCASDDQCDALTEKVASMHNQLEKTKADFEMQLTQSKTDVEEARNKLKRRSEEMSQRFESLEETLGNKKRKLAEVEGVLDSQRAKVFQYDHLVKRCETLEARNSELEKENRVMRRECEDIRGNFELQITKLKLQIDMQS